MLVKLTTAYAYNGETLAEGDIIAVTEIVADNLFLKGYAVPAHSIISTQVDGDIEPPPQVDDDDTEPPPQVDDDTEPPPQETKTVALGRSQNNKKGQHATAPKKGGKK